MFSPPLFLHADMDAFFAAVEIHDDPALAGRPVVVGADPKAGRGVVSACSYEARRYGIHSAMPITEAYRRCPAAAFREPRMNRYTEVSGTIMGVFAEFSPLVEPLSVDEAFLDIAGMGHLHTTPETLARALKDRVRTATGLAVSVGVAARKFLAKIASDYGKPDGLLVVPRGGEAAFLAPLPISRLWGVGKAMQARLETYGIKTIGQIAALPATRLAGWFGKSGQALWELANAIDERQVVTERTEKSLSRETTFHRDTADETVLLAELHRQALDVAQRLARRALAGRVVHVKYRTADFTTRTRSRTLPAATADAALLFAVGRELFFAARGGPGETVRLLGLGASGLEKDGAAPALFADGEAERRNRVARTCFELREKFGTFSLVPAALVRGHGKEKDQ